jgi:hypothetical protein
MIQCKNEEFTEITKGLKRSDLLKNITRDGVEHDLGERVVGTYAASVRAKRG